MPIDDEQKQRDYNQILADTTSKTKDYARSLTSSAKALLKYASNEKEQNQILKEHIKNLKKQVEIEKSKDNVDKNKIKFLNDEIDATKSLTTGFKFALPKLQSFGAYAAIGAKKLLEFGVELSKSTVKTAGRFFDAGERIKNFSDLTKDFKIPGLESLAAAVDFNTENFKILSQTGAGFNGSLVQLREAAHSANMPIMDFVDMIQQNSSSMARLFGSVQSGIPQIQSFARSVRDMTRNDLAQFGLNFEETNEFMQTYLELERSRGAVQRKSTAEVVAGTRQYARNLVLLSKLTGEDVKKLDQKNKEAARDGVFRALLANKTPEVALGFTNMLGTMQTLGPGFEALFKDVVAFRGPVSDAAVAMNVLTRGRLIPLMKSFDGSQESIIALTNATKEASAFSIRNNQNLAKAVLAGANEFQQGFTDISNAAGRAVDTSVIQGEMNARDGTTKALVGFREEIDQTKVAFEKGTTSFQKLTYFGDKTAETLDKLNSGLKGLQTFVPNAPQRISEGFKNIGTEKGYGRGTILSLADDSMFGMAKRAGQRFGAGGPGNSLLDILTPWDTLAEKIAQQQLKYDTGEHYATGTKGKTGEYFKDFGSGTRVALHNVEAVIPKNSPMGAMVSMLDKIIKTPTNSVPKPTTTEKDYSEFFQNLVTGITSLGTKMDESKNMLNTIAGASAKTADNTGKQIKTLARNPYSIV